MPQTGSMEGKVVLITGATDGIGRQTALELARLGARVVVHGRNEQKARQVAEWIRHQSGNPQVEAMAADLASFRQIREMAEAFQQRFPHLHVLINNAGVFEPTRRVSEDGYEMTFAVNHLAPFLLTGLLLEKIWQSRPARIVTVSSMAHVHTIDFDNLQGEKGYDGYTAYSLSKLCNILFTFELAERLKGTGVTANCLHPGVIRTKLLHAGWGMGGAPVEVGAQTSVYLASAPELEQVTGKYFSNRREARPAAIAYRPEVRRKLWELSEQMTGFRYGEVLEKLIS